MYPINPGRDSVLGYKAYPNVRDIPGDVDMAVFTVPAAKVVDAVEDCVAKKVKAGVIISAGFKELGGESADMEKQMVKTARAGNMVLVGPNGQGICSPSTKLFPWMPHSYHPPVGSVGVISQSGNIQSMLIEGVIKSGFGVSKCVSSGNEADLRSEDFFAYLAEDDETNVILAYIEGITDGHTGRQICRQIPHRIDGRPRQPF
jgi:acyl-CoA synthetase (NDP forming)